MKEIYCGTLEGRFPRTRAKQAHDRRRKSGTRRDCGLEAINHIGWLPVFGRLPPLEVASKWMKMKALKCILSYTYPILGWNKSWV